MMRRCLASSSDLDAKPQANHQMSIQREKVIERDGGCRSPCLHSAVSGGRWWY
ncbi:hypothetical protein HanRHA438_Chr09g0376581 [Helianthus annuus]|uniref:Uncharacterized protein n=1 Tax=Helianthus annuus TaxID=4232 RepID=A0A251TTW2_HELAN|nr:hypothetical protein HanXRQr2_Chr09g0365031 [Helianthus annuus]KAJ0540736.1 hypothetical protein HanHA89_Chr09g0320271 [Helianthus annuus]KAJ0886193.1 hypothetical protein HanRHA438_Chr09g0376581 [Helianthus annuus]